MYWDFVVRLLRGIQAIEFLWIIFTVWIFALRYNILLKSNFPIQTNCFREFWHWNICTGIISHRHKYFCVCERLQYELYYEGSWRWRPWLIVCVNRQYVTTEAVIAVSKRYRLHYNYGDKPLLSKLTGDLTVDCCWIGSQSCCIYFLNLGFCMFDNDWNSCNWQILAQISDRKPSLLKPQLSWRVSSWIVGEWNMWWEVVVSLPLVKFYCI